MSTKIRQFIKVFSGTSLIGIGISLNYLANLGLGPWGVFHDGLSKTLGISYGRTIIITGVAVMLLWIPLKQKPGLGTIVDIFLVGIVADLIILNFELSDSIFLSLTLIAFGIILIGAGTAIYVGADLGAGPRDGVMVGLETIGLKIGTARNLIELFANFRFLNVKLNFSKFKPSDFKALIKFLIFILLKFSFPFEGSST